MTCAEFVGHVCRCFVGINGYFVLGSCIPPPVNNFSRASRPGRKKVILILRGFVFNKTSPVDGLIGQDLQ